MPTKAEFIAKRPMFTALLSGYFGCLAGSVHIPFQTRRPDGTKVNTKGGTLQSFYKRFNGLSSRAVVEDVYFTTASIDKDNIIRQNKVEGVVFSGEKPCFRLVVANGLEITTTADHQFYVGNGKFKCLSELSVGESVFIHDNTILALGRQPRKSPRKFFYVKHHPTARKKTVSGRTVGKYSYDYHVVPRARAVVEAFMNGLALGAYIERLNGGQLEALQVLPKDVDVHHKNEDTLDDSYVNLEVLGHSEHIGHHSSENPRLKYVTHPVEITSIVSVGVLPTYDIQMQEPMNNFIANGIVVHNSGKTIQSLSFPKCYVISVDPAGLEPLRQPRNQKFLDNLVEYDELGRESQKDLKTLFDENSKDRASLYGCIERAKELAAKEEVETIVIDGGTYLVDLYWAKICELEQVKSATTGNVDTQSMYRSLGLGLYRMFAANLLTTASRANTNLIVTFHLKRESEEQMQGNSKKARKLMLNSDIALQIEGGFRNKVEGLFGGSLYLEKKLDNGAIKYSAICDVEKAFQTTVLAKNRWNLPPRIDLNNKSLYEHLMEVLRVPAKK